MDKHIPDASNNSENNYFIGIMSGTSLDGVDVVLASIPSSKEFSLLVAETYQIPEHLKNALLQLSQADQPNELAHYAELDVQMGRLFAECSLRLIDKSGVLPSQIQAIGNHGQTLRHYPDSQFPTTLQIGDPNIIAQATGITTIADFRRRDMAAGGQGAPLVPPFHQAIFSHKNLNRVIVNIGGIANITTLPKNSAHIIGYDTGPGNGLMDDWCLRNFDCSYDKDGQIASEGNLNPELLEQMFLDPYFSKQSPKSTGREYFSYEWITQQLESLSREVSKADVLSTLLELSAYSIINEISSLDYPIDEILICGGGTKNTQLMQRLQTLALESKVASTEQLGLHPDWVEASAFAWLAHQTLNGLTGNLPSVTGASQKVVLGAIWPA